MTSKINVLGIGISATNYDEVVQIVIDKAKNRKPLAVTALAVHGLTFGSLHRYFGDRLRQFDIVAPDGQPIRWAMNALSGVGLKERVYGPTLMLKICERAAIEQVPIYLYGSYSYVLDALKLNLLKTIPELQIAGMKQSLFRTLTKEEDQEHILQIRNSGAGIVFVGLGCPLQENWIFEHRLKISLPLIAVGAAFDFHAENKPQAPYLLQKYGFEWLFRLISEPHRLWRRYLIYNSIFTFQFFLQYLRIILKNKNYRYCQND